MQAGAIRGFLAGLAALLLVFSAETASAQVIPPPSGDTGARTETGQAVIVRGNRRIETATIVSYLQLVPGQVVTAADLNAAVRRMFDTGLFADVSIVPADRQLIINVVENPAINQIAFEGNDVLEDEELRQIISLRPRLPFTASAAEADAQAIIEVYRRTGRFGAEVEPVIIRQPDNRVDLVFEISEGEVTGVSSIDFVGNETYSDRRLRGAIETAESGILASFFGGDVYDPDRLELDKELLGRYYRARGHADFAVLSATAELSPDRDGFFITFVVEEGPIYTFGNLDVQVNARGLDIAEFEALLPDLTGETYDEREVEAIIDEMSELASTRGFAFVRVRPRASKNPDDLSIDITFELIEGNRIFVERIEIVGNTRTLDRVIRRQFDLVEGDIFNARKIREARNRIRALNYFSSIDIETTEGSAEDRAVLTVRVEEQSTGSLSFGLGFSTSDGPLGQVSITERNFLGRGQTVRAQVSLTGDTQIYDFAFTEPAFLDRDLSVTLAAFFIDDDRSDESSFNEVRAGFRPSISFPLAEDTGVTVFYLFERSDIDPVQDDNPAVLTDVSNVIVADEGVNFASILGYDVQYDGRNDPIEPTEGYILSFGQDFAGLGGDSQFVRSRARGKVWTSFFDEEVILSAEIEWGAITTFGQDTRITERFFLGGQSLRGFASEGLGPRDELSDDALGGNFLLASRFEVSFPLGLPEELGIYGGLFVDIGSVWALNGEPFGNNGRTIDDSFELRAAIGGLLFVDTPFGPLELSFGFPVLEGDFDETEFFRLTVGTRF